jgi:hypothetical protein
MNRWFSCVPLALASAAVMLSCSDKSPSQPSSSSDGSGGTSSVTAPSPLAPAIAAQIANTEQPLTLVVKNAVVTQNALTTYTFEVASDSNFATKVFGKSGVASSTGGQTSVTIDKLPAGADYYWHARAEGGGTLGPFSGARKFTIGPAVVLNPPIPVGPLSGSSPAGWPTFVITNSTRIGPVGSVSYRFEVSTNPNFSPVTLTATVAETPNQTKFTPSTSQPMPTPQVTLYWRAIAIDTTNNVSSPASAVQSFIPTAPSQASLVAAQLGVLLWPGAQPPGNNGQARMGPGWQVGTIRSFNGVTFVSPPIDTLQIFDLLDRGFSPDGAIAWMKNNGYSTTGVYYASVAAIGFPYQYMAFVSGAWELVTRVGA